MNLDLDVQLQVALRALEEVVAPALGSAEKHVVEQFHLALVTLGFVKTRLPDARRFARMDLRHMADLTRQALELEQAGPEPDLAAVLADVERVLASPEADTAEIVSASRRLRDEITALGSRCNDPAHRAALDRLVLDHGQKSVAQARQWCAPFGFELKPEDLPAPAW